MPIAKGSIHVAVCPRYLNAYIAQEYLYITPQQLILGSHRRVSEYSAENRSRTYCPITRYA